MEKKYIITYELKNKTKDYSTLYQAIKNLSKYWWHYIDSSWVVKHCELNSDEIFEKLRSHIDTQTDYILVIEINTENKQGWLPKKAWNWLKS